MVGCVEECGGRGGGVWEGYRSVVGDGSQVSCAGYRSCGT